MGVRVTVRPESVQTIVDMYRKLIDTERLLPGQRIPPAHEIAARQGVHRNTAYQAVKELQTLGYVTSTQGGTRVLRGGAARRLEELRRVLADMEAHGDHPVPYGASDGSVRIVCEDGIVRWDEETGQWEVKEIS